MKHLIAVTLSLASFHCATAQQNQAKIYIWLVAGKGMVASYYQNSNYELIVNSKRIGSFYGKDIVEMDVQMDKRYFVELFAGGRLIASYQTEDISESHTYLHLNTKSRVELAKMDATSGGLFVMNTANYERKLVFNAEGMDGVNSGKGPRSGSGFLIDSAGYIITNYHVIEDAKKVTVKGIEGDYTTEYLADVLAKDINNDIAIIQLKNKAIRYSKIPWGVKTTTASTGEEIFILGYPMKSALGEEVKLTTGVISSKTGFDGSISSYQVSAPAQPGNSGGPIFDKNGNLLGVINAKIRDGENITYAVKSFYIQPLISTLVEDETQVLNSENILTGKSLAEIVSAVSKFVYIIEVE